MYVFSQQNLLFAGRYCSDASPMKVEISIGRFMANTARHSMKSNAIFKCAEKKQWSVAIPHVMQDPSTMSLMR